MIQLVTDWCAMLAKWCLSLIVGLTLFGVSYSGAFRPAQTDPLTGPVATKFLKVFAGFSYAGAYSCPGFEVPVHGVERMAAPTGFDREKCYVFHLPVESADVDPDVFVRRMREQQVEPVRYPKSDSEVIHPVDGGSIYRIDFRVNRVDGSLLSVQGTHAMSPGATAWKPEDYLLVFARR
ncbi:MAG: hypothetical protein ABI759_12850 [Candidatus Solibacter sp.]